MRKESHRKLPENQSTSVLPESAAFQEVAEALSLLSQDARDSILNNLHAFIKVSGAKFAQALDGSAVGTGHGQIFVEIIFCTDEILAAARGASNG